MTRRTPARLPARAAERHIDLAAAEAPPVRVGVVGCGYWGSKHVRVLHGLGAVSELAAIDSSRERRTELARTFPALREHEALESALDGLDAVVIATPPVTHARLAQQALAAGKHVLIEKPMTTCSADARALVEQAEEAGLVLMVGHTFEFNPAVMRLRELMEEGAFGEIFYLDGARLNLGLYRHDVNVVWDLAPHDVSIANFLLGSSPVVVQAWGASHANDAVEDVAYLRLGYPDNGIFFQTHVSWLSPSKVRRLTVVGSRRMAVYNDLRDNERLRIYDKGVVAPADDDLHQVPMSYRYGDITSPYIRFDEPLKLLDEHFVRSVQLGSRPRSDGRTGLAVVEVLEAATRSMEQGGRAVELSPAARNLPGV